MKKITGTDAIAYAERSGIALSKYTDPTEDARIGLPIAEARGIAAEDPDLIYVEVPDDIFTADEIGSAGIRHWMDENGFAALTLVAESGVADKRLAVYAAPDGRRVMETNADPVFGGDDPTCEDCASTAERICGCGAIRCKEHAHFTCAHDRDDERLAETLSALWPSLRRDCFNF